MTELTALTTNRTDRFSEYTDPMLVETQKMTKTYIISPDRDLKTTEDVLTKEGYRMEEMIDSGAFATVFKAIHIQRKTVVAIKVIEIPPDLGSGQSNKKRTNVLSDIKNELFILEKSFHPHIIHLITHFLVQHPNREVLHIVMQLAEGGTLSKFLDKFGPFEENTCRVWFAQMVSALSFMHLKFGIAHRDLKLSNILLDRDNDILISDFGLSRVVWRKSRDGIMESKTFCGTPPYMSPELLDHMTSKQGYNAIKADVWALGVILFKLFNKEYPFPQKRSKAIRRMKAERWKWSQHIRHQPSADFVDIMKKLFQPDVSLRIDTRDLKEHKWIKHLLIDDHSFDSKSIRKRDKEHRTPKEQNATNGLVQTQSTTENSIQQMS